MLETPARSRRLVDNPTGRTGRVRVVRQVFDPASATPPHARLDLYRQILLINASQEYSHVTICYE
jgi:hypothetical protein